MGYAVGQVLYVVLRKQPVIAPMLVVEEITKRSLAGEEKSYVLQAGAQANKLISLDDVDGEIFNSAGDAERSLLARATENIRQRVAQAEARAAEWYPRTGEAHAAAAIASTSERAEVVLPDGTRVRVNSVQLPPELQG